ncbi:2-amino-1-hydroxyethylphosphonate dioxygenase (glycine-forming)-like [Oscarella lobularis]|uniref:2-amino-1-hydroxyethylphosphonate dioxygenase (glycine-forming)-like n=1 Tax=Oscarella lobularis TaxID=121494 RepID=UPI0033131DEC
MVQCAELAEKEGYDEDVVLGAFFHDVGHLIGLKDSSYGRMGQLGTVNHEEVGARYLKSIGFSDTICNIVRGHVSAKRYLVYKEPHYYESLSDASKGTLVHQGGAMSEEEARDFENFPSFRAILRMRYWDDKAKDPSIPVSEESLKKYEKLSRKLLGNVAQ